MLNFIRQLFAYALLLCFATTSFAGLFDDEEARKAIIDLRQKVEAVEQNRLKDRQAAQDLPQGLQTLQQSVQTMQQSMQGMRDENAVLKRNLLEMQSFNEQLRSDLSKQVGLVEQLTKDVSEIQRRQRDLAQGVEERMRKLEPIKVSIEGKDFLADPSEVKEFDTALALLRKADFKSATSAFVDFLRRYPQSGYQSLGLFWLGSSQYATRDYREAIINFKASVDANSASSKAPEALLAMANSQLELKDTRAARRTLEDLIKVYPQSEAAAAGRDRLTRLR
jgi:tol-pal system protein YbgF